MTGAPRRVEPATAPTRLPFEVTAPVVGAALVSHLLVAARDDASNSVLVCSIDREGRLTPPRKLPLDFVSSMARCDERAILIGNRGPRWIALTLDAAGAVIDDRELLSDSGWSLTPRTVPDSEPPCQYWVDDQDRLVIACAGQIRATAMEEWTLDMAAQPTPRGIALVRSAGVRGRLELLLWEQGSPRIRCVGEGAEQGHSPQLHRVGTQFWVLWASRVRRAVCMQEFSAEGDGRGPVRELVKAAPPRSLIGMSSVLSEDGCLAVVWRTEWPGADFGQDGEPMPEVGQQIALVDTRTGKVGEPISPMGSADGCSLVEWVADRLVCVWGSSRLVSVYRRALV